MPHTVGTKGQVVIEQAIRERLGVQPGWQALQTIVDDHVEIYFVPPPHRRSLRGRLAAPAGESGRGAESEEELHQASEEAWAEAVRPQSELPSPGGEGAL